MVQNQKPPEDPNLLAKYIVNEVKQTAKREPKKNPAAVALGRLGGIKGGRARALKLTAQERKEIAIKAAKARWSSRK